MNLKSRIGSLLAMLVMLSCFAALFKSCDSAIYDNQKECVLKYLVRFKYDRNLKFADAFAHEVNQVTLYVIDDAGNVVWQKTESGDKLAIEGYAMEVEGPPGHYNLLAWCSSEHPTTFTTGNSQIATELKTRFQTESLEDGTQHIKASLDRLYHGYVADVNFLDALEGEYVYTVPLTKDTNHIMVALQQLDGEPLDKDLVEFEITDDNIYLDWDNSPILGNPITYHQWYKETIQADMSVKAKATRADDAVNSFSGVIAELTTSRLMENHRDKARLRIYRSDTGETIASIRLIDALLLAMNYENRKQLTPQQYLDYKDDYNLTFFLDANHKWLDGMIQIESWRLVYKEQILN